MELPKHSQVTPVGLVLRSSIRPEHMMVRILEVQGSSRGSQFITISKAIEVTPPVPQIQEDLVTQQWMSTSKVPLLTHPISPPDLQVMSHHQVELHPYPALPAG